MSLTKIPQYFDAIYRANSDPWNYRSSDYERGKYAETLAALPPRRFGDAFEIGCSIGVLTAQLAERCDRLLAVDASEVALGIAREGCAALPNVELRRMLVPSEYPDRRFDLVLLSEVGMFWTPAELDIAATRIIESLAAPGWLLLVHWLAPGDHPLVGDDVHEHFIARCGPDSPLAHRHGVRREKYRLDLVERVR